MKRFFRRPDLGLSGYAALGVFGLSYLAAVALVVVPEQGTPARNAPIAWIAK